MSFKKIVLGLLFCATGVFAATVQVTDLVGFNGATPAQDLPAVIKANSGWVPLVQVQVSSNTALASEVYKVYSITFTLDSNNFFNAAVDLNGAVADSLRVFTDTACTSAVPGTITHKIAGQTVTAFAGTDPETIEIEFGTPVNVSTNSATSPTFLYVAVKTGSGISDGDVFRVQWNNANEFCVRVSSSAGTVNQDIIPAAANGSFMTADIYAPAITVNYSPDADKGTTNTVENQDNDNVYKTGDTIDLNIYVTEPSGVGNESAANLRGDAGVVTLNDCIEISASSILGSLGSGTTIFTDQTGGIFRVQYTITDSDVNQNTDGATALSFGIKIKDGAGNESAWDTSFKLYIDSKTPDAVSLTAPANSAYANTKSPVFSWTASNEAHLSNYVMV
ncbi:hypothetical protein FP828_03835, partial [bacterium]|nr:hypothetical protein [bacterium]